MSCPNCYNFSQSKSQKDLGDITDENSCAGCLYWYAGPGGGASECKCDDMFENITNEGSKFDLNRFNQVKDCLSIPDNLKTCGNLYTQFTNPPKPEELGPHFGLVGGYWGNPRREQFSVPEKRFKDLGKEDQHPYGYYSPCTGKVASPDFSNDGVL
jgi:hypothetical protein